MTADNCQRLRAVVNARNNSGRTHWDSCYLDPTHRDCAITMLLDERDRLAAELAELKNGEPTDAELMAAAVDAQRRADRYAKKFGELAAELAELRAMKIAYQDTPKQWSTAQAPTLEAIMQTATLHKSVTDRKRLMARVVELEAALRRALQRCPCGEHGCPECDKDAALLARTPEATR